MKDTLVKEIGDFAITKSNEYNLSIDETIECIEQVLSKMLEFRDKL